MQSLAVTAVASCRTQTSLFPVRGSGTSLICSTSGGPYAVQIAAFTSLPRAHSDHGHVLGDLDPGSRWPCSPCVEQPFSAARGKPRWSYAVAEVTAQLRGVGDAHSKLGVLGADQRDETPLNDRSDRVVGGIDQRLEHWVDQRADRLAPARCAHGDERPPGAVRLNADEESTRCQVAPGSLEGMDHALDRDSSKRPAEQRDVECSSAQPNAFGRAGSERDVGDALGCEIVPGDGDAGAVLFDGDDFPRHPRVLSRQPAVAASDLENSLARRIDEAPDQAQLHSRRWI